jgi:hypothetical protein
MTDLIERLEAATEGSRELDALIHATTLSLGRDYWPDERGRVVEYTGLRKILHRAPHYTTSIDAALTLVPEGWGWSVNDDSEACLTLPGNGFLSDRGDIELYGRSATPAIALCIAALRARQGRE